jgi:Rac GTPase-activating protein 1
MDEEKQSRKKAEVERDAFASQLEEVRRILLNDPRYGKLPDETRERLSFLNKSLTYGSSRKNLNDRLMAVEESDSTASILSDFSFSRSGDDLDDSVSLRSARRTRRSYFADENAGTIKRKKSMQTVEQRTPVVTRSMKVASYTPTAPRAESLDSLTSDEPNFDEKKQNFRTPIIERINAQTHSFVTHNTFMRQSCQYCTKKIGFSRTMWKCKGCMAVAHTECIDKVPLPCIPMGTPKRGVSNTIAAYAPMVPPMIPANIIHCVNEIEQRGLEELGIYK